MTSPRTQAPSPDATSCRLDASRTATRHAHSCITRITERNFRDASRIYHARLYNYCQTVIRVTVAPSPPNIFREIKLYIDQSNKLLFLVVIKTHVCFFSGPTLTHPGTGEPSARWNKIRVVSTIKNLLRKISSYLGFEPGLGTQFETCGDI